MSEEIWKTIYRRFDPEQPVPMERPEWYAERTYSPLDRIQKKLSLPIGTPRVLLMGTVGTGKTSELRRLAEARASQEFVLLLDLAEHFDKVAGNNEALQHINAWEVCFLVGLAVYQAAQDRLSYQWDADVLPGLEAAWRAAAGASGVEMPKQLDLSKLAKAVLSGASVVLGGTVAELAVKGAIKMAEGAADTFKWNVPLGKAQHALADDTEASRNLLDRVNRIINELEIRHRRVVLIIDGLDRIREVARARALFIESDVLSRLVCPLVLCAPFALRHHHAVTTVRGFNIFLLVNEPVLQQGDPRSLGNGYGFFRDLFQKRTIDLGEQPLIEDAQLRRLAYYSGGRARDFVRMIREVAEIVLGSRVWQVTEEVVTQVLDELRQLLEMGLHRGHIDLLRAVVNDPEHRMPQDDLVWELLASWRLLPYPNESEWFYPHPLLTLRLVKIPPYGSTRSSVP